MHFVVFHGSYRPYAYDVTEGRPRGVGGQTRHATCTIAKHALRGQTPACLTAELARVRTLTERVSANALCQQNMCAQRDKSWPPAWRRCYGDVTSMHKVYSTGLGSESLYATMHFYPHTHTHTHTCWTFNRGLQPCIFDVRNFACNCGHTLQSFHGWTWAFLCLCVKFNYLTMDYPLPLPKPSLDISFYMHAYVIQQCYWNCPWLKVLTNTHTHTHTHTHTI